MLFYLSEFSEFLKNKPQLFIVKVGCWLSENTYAYANLKIC